eukprot:5771015-Prymnesium_polylepis.1
MCFAPSFLRSPGGAVTRISESKRSRNAPHAVLRGVRLRVSPAPTSDMRLHNHEQTLNYDKHTCTSDRLHSLVGRTSGVESTWVRLRLRAYRDEACVFTTGG